MRTAITYEGCHNRRVWPIPFPYGDAYEIGVKLIHDGEEIAVEYEAVLPGHICGAWAGPHPKAGAGAGGTEAAGSDAGDGAAVSGDSEADDEEKRVWHLVEHCVICEVPEGWSIHIWLNEPYAKALAGQVQRARAAELAGMYEAHAAYHGQAVAANAAEAVRRLEAESGAIVERCAQSLKQLEDATSDENGPMHRINELEERAGAIERDVLARAAAQAQTDAGIIAKMGSDIEAVADAINGDYGPRVEALEGESASLGERAQALEARVRSDSLLIFCDAVNGDDDNDGKSAATAFKTLDKAIAYGGNYVYPHGYSCNIRLAAGAYPCKDFIYPAYPLNISGPSFDFDDLDESACATISTMGVETDSDISLTWLIFNQTDTIRYSAFDFHGRAKLGNLVIRHGAKETIRARALSRVAVMHRMRVSRITPQNNADDAAVLVADDSAFLQFGSYNAADSLLEVEGYYFTIAMARAANLRVHTVARIKPFGAGVSLLSCLCAAYAGGVVHYGKTSFSGFSKTTCIANTGSTCTATD